MSKKLTPENRKKINALKAYGYTVVQDMAATDNPNEFLVSGSWALSVWTRYFDKAISVEVIGDYYREPINKKVHDGLGMVFYFKNKTEAHLAYSKINEALILNGVKINATYDKATLKRESFLNNSNPLILTSTEVLILRTDENLDLINKLVDALDISEEEVDGIDAEALLI